MLQGTTDASTAAAVDVTTALSKKQRGSKKFRQKKCISVLQHANITALRDSAPQHNHDPSISIRTRKGNIKPRGTAQSAGSMPKPYAKYDINFGIGTPCYWQNLSHRCLRCRNTHKVKKWALTTGATNPQ